MQAAQVIRDAVSQVSARRRACARDPALALAVAQVKQFQARRFAAIYADLLSADPYCHAAQFFLDELYGEQDFARRDLQFARIAGALQRIFPQEVSATAVALAELHALTEMLDFKMGQAWLQRKVLPPESDAACYVRTWRTVGAMEQRQQQLSMVLALGVELEKLVRMPGLRLMLRMMRRPAQAAGLGDLQCFLESGFDHFSSMARQKGLTSTFLHTIEQRESRWFALLFDADPVACATELACALGQAP
jgi:hypothetical protein